MVYLSLSVKNVEDAVNFYCVKLGLFRDCSGGRIVCKFGPRLIVDLEGIGTEEHLHLFGRSTHEVTNFWVSYRGEDKPTEQIEIRANLKKYDVQYKESKGLGGHRFRFVDPSGNKFMISDDFSIFC